ncbi:MAG: PPK2 family polyphosphate kinase [Ignavibacteria bacterium]
MSNYDLLSVSTKPPEELEKDTTKEKIKEYTKEIGELQDVLFAERKHSLLIVIQGQDASGKDGAIKKVFDDINPQGVMVKSFKVPTEEELSHDFLWRIHKHTPEKGMIQIFNRSHYEDVLVTRVLGFTDDKTASLRFKLINSFEQQLQAQETIILKFYLHISEEEQKKRFEERLNDPKKQWKYSSKDWDKAKDWPKYRKYYQDVFENCSPEIPWTIVPSDKNWYKEYLISKKIADTMRNLNMKYPDVKKEQ